MEKSGGQQGLGTKEHPTDRTAEERRREEKTVAPRKYGSHRQAVIFEKIGEERPPSKRLPKAPSLKDSGHPFMKVPVFSSVVKESNTVKETVASFLRSDFRQDRSPHVISTT